MSEMWCQSCEQYKPSQGAHWIRVYLRIPPFWGSQLECRECNSARPY